MSGFVILDIILALLLIGLTVFGAVRGLYKSVAGLLVLILALTGANWLTGVSAAGVMETVRPVVEKRIEERVSDAVEEDIPQKSPSALNDAFSKAEAILQRFGWEGNLQETIENRTRDSLAKAERAIAMKIVDAFLEDIVTSLLKVIYFVVLFAVLLLLSKLLAPLIDRLPVIGKCNHIGGGIAGFAVGMLAVYIVLWFCTRTALLSEESNSVFYHLLNGLL